ncbi:MAG: hypothetical protein ACYDHT_06080 [Solirubrobacteraceae bacterium]
MPPRPPAFFYVVAFTALVLLIAGLALSIQDDEPAFPAAATGIGAIGMFVCAWMLRRIS